MYLNHVIIIIEIEVMSMNLIKKVLVYIADRQVQKQDLLRKKHNCEQIKLILQDL